MPARPEEAPLLPPLYEQKGLPGPDGDWLSKRARLNQAGLVVVASPVAAQKFVTSFRADSGKGLATVSTKMFRSSLLLLVIKLKKPTLPLEIESQYSKDSMTAHSSRGETLAGGVQNVRGLQKHRLHRKLQNSLKINRRASR